MQTFPARHIAFAMSLLDQPTFSGNGITLEPGPSHRSTLPIKRLELAQNPLAGQPPILLLHTQLPTPIEINEHTHILHSLRLSPDHPLLKTLPKSPFHTDLLHPHTLTLPETHTLLSNWFDPLQLPQEVITSWPHPLTLTLHPKWPEQLHISNHTNHPFKLKISYPFSPSNTAHPTGKTPTTGRYVSCTLRELPLHTRSNSSPIARPLLDLLALANNILLDLLIPHIPPCWLLVRIDPQEPTASDTHPIQITPLEVLAHPNPSMRHNLASSSYAFLFVPNGPDSSDIPFNVSISSDLLASQHIHTYDTLFPFPADQSVQTASCYVKNALTLLKNTATTAIQQTLLC